MQQEGTDLRKKEERQNRVQKRKQFAEAVELFTNLLAQQGETQVSLSPEYLQYALALGDLYLRYGRQEEAARWYQMAEQAADGMLYAQACRRLGATLFAKGDQRKALQKWVNAKNYLEEYEETQTELYCQLLADIGDCFFRMGEKEKAVRMYLPYIRLLQELELPRDRGYMQRLERTAKAFSDWKKHAQAAEYYSELALALRETEGETETFARILLKTAVCHIAQGNQQQAQTLLDRALLLGAQAGRETEAYGRLCDKIGRLYAANGSLERAADTLSIAYEMNRLGRKCLTRDGMAALLSVFRRLDDKKRYFSAKDGEKLE